ncbi:MAG: hypothetical protein V4719_08715 [Planctomycetota bacterium]
MRSSMTRFFKVTGLLAVASVWALTPAVAKDPAAVEVKVGEKTVAVGVETQPAAVVIPECLAKLELTAEQQKQVKDVVSQSAAVHAKVWGQFSERYLQMIAVESSMLAAIEDNLTEPQLTHVRTHRRKTAHHGRTAVATPKPATAIENELEKDGVLLTDEQAAASDSLQEKYHTNLHVLHREIQGLHARLLALEADKLVQIEKVLTKEQLAQLRTNRRNAPVALKLATSNPEPAKAE